ncbi:MAG: serine protease [Acidobacteriota bacterium]
MLKTLARTAPLYLVAMLLLAGSAFGAAEVGPYIPSEKADAASQVDSMAALHAELSSLAGHDKVAALEVHVPAERLAALKSQKPDNGPLWVGVHGAIDFAFDPANKSQFGHRTVADGMVVWSGAFRSAGASGVRLHLEDVALPDGAELYVFGHHGHAFGPYTGQHKELWTNTVAGDEIVLQVHSPMLSTRTEGALFRVSQLSHLGDRYEFGFHPEKAFCSWNDSCILNAECASIPSAVQVAQDAVAYLIFSLPGGSFICSGGLLNDETSSGTPYFLTANHCFSTQSAATSLEAYFQWTVGCGASCGSQYNPPGSVPRVLGASLLATSANTDFTFLELNSAAPAGSAFLGWTTNAVANSAGTSLYRVSHPSGSPQAYSEQSVNASAGTCGGYPRGRYIYSDATLADSEGGSSGSPVVNSSGQVVGQLFGACGATPEVTCDNDDRTVDGAFAVTYSSIASFLAGDGGGDPGGDGCTGNNVWTGTASSSTPNLTTPNCTAGGSFTGELVCDVGAADLDLYLEKESCGGWFGCSFSTVASSTSAGCNESVTTSSSNGTHRWRVNYYSGPAESFTLCTNKC